ncbi:MAG: DUF4430 domain-containing protein [Clostridiales bacterium]|jgi:hypothetical protein|nr:DUF4430 domain-containing protein [Clostridiales bacterium]
MSKKVIAILLISLIFLFYTGCNNASQDKADTIGTIKLDIYFPDDYEASDISVEYPIKDGDTALSILVDFGKEEGVAVVLSENRAYVSGINGLFEKDYGDLFGWLYWVNDESPTVGAAEYVLSDGDHIVWEYVDFSEIW